MWQGGQPAAGPAQVSAYCLVFPQYGLYAGEFLRGKPARERAQNGPDACAPPALLLGRSGLSPWGGKGHWCPQPPLHPPNCCCGDLPPSEPTPLGLGLGRALNRGRSSSASLWAWRSVLEGAEPPACPTLGRTWGPAKGQGLILEVLGHPPQPHPEAPPAGGGVPTPRMSRLSRGAVPLLVCPLPFPRLSLQTHSCPHLPQPSPPVS